MSQELRQEEYTGKRFYGKYRGTVVDNNDPLFKGRIRAIVPSISAFNISTWIEPCSPFVGPGSGCFFVPTIKASVFVEFIEGNPNFACYSGGSWSDADLAVIPPQSKPFVVPGEAMIQTMTGSSITFSIKPPGITIQTIDMKKISINSTGIEISLGSPGVGITIDPKGAVNVTTPTSVSINAPKVSINSP